VTENESAASIISATHQGLLACHPAFWCLLALIHSCATMGSTSCHCLFSPHFPLDSFQGLLAFRWPISSSSGLRPAHHLLMSRRRLLQILVKSASISAAAGERN